MLRLLLAVDSPVATFTANSCSFTKYCQNWGEIQVLEKKKKKKKKERGKTKRELRGCGLRTFQACVVMRTLAKISLKMPKKYHSNVIVSDHKTSSHFSLDLSLTVLMMH